MTQLTHERARQLIQLKADQLLLGSREDQLLQAHLATCSECHVYSENIRDLEDILRNVARRKLENRPAPLSMEVVLGRVRERQQKRSSRALLATRSIAILGAVLILIVGTWQLSQIVVTPTPPVAATMLPTPVPAAQLTHTSLALDACEHLVYQVRSDDILESIAQQFGVSESDILSFNQLPSETLVPGMEIKIPICKSTPTSNAPTTTITPQFTPVTTTPG